MTNEEVILKIKNLCISLNRPIHKKDINKKNGFDCGYSTLVNRGVLFKDIPFYEIIYNSAPRKCDNCKNILNYNQRHNKFCSKSCAAQVNNKKAPKRIKGKVYPNDRSYNSFIIKKAETCMFCIEKHYKKSKYCTMKCRNDFLYMERFLEWYYNTGDFSGSALLIKGYITMMVGYKCSECGISTYNDKPLTLHLEHKDGNAINNSKDNLCLLCPNCHALTPTYGARNIGNGKRTWRKERYHAGKSY